jgi:hypothetical protein
MTIDGLLSLAGLTANDEIPVWDAEAVDEPTKKITAQNLAASVKALAGLVGEAELTEQLADKADVIVDTASGAIASFPDGAAVAAKDITIGIEPVQAGSGDPSPTNVRPISGWTGANVTRTGKNLLPTLSAENAIKYNGSELTVANVSGGISVTGFGGAYHSVGFLFDKVDKYIGKSLTISCKMTSVGGLPRVMIMLCDENFQNRSDSQYFDATGSKTVTFSSGKEGKYIGIALFSTIGPDGPSIVSTYTDIQIELGSTATTYEPYTGTTYPISWQSEAGTIYGGTLDVTTGLLRVTMAEVDLGTLYWSYDGRFAAPLTQAVPTEGKTTINAVCSKYRWTNVYNTGDKTFFISNAHYLSMWDSAYTDAATFKAAMSGVQLVYELVTPQTYQLTPTEVDTVLGNNNVWADTGDSTVAYRADTKLYIQKINAPTDDDMIADAQIASGKYFIVGGNLYRSTTTIPAGDAINPGSNCILTNLADALNALNT